MNNASHAKRLRERADEFRRAAEKIPEVHTKRSFLELARSYDELAKAEEAVSFEAVSPPSLLGEAMYSSENCRVHLQECKDLLSLAGSQAEATVLNLLIRNWQNIANQTDRYTELARNKPPKE